MNYQSSKIDKVHRFIDEAGDTTFFGKGKESIIGKNGVSMSFALGMVKVNEDLHDLRQRIEQKAIAIQDNPYYANVPSVRKRIQSHGRFYFHAKDDIPEIRKEFYDFLLGVDFSLQAVIGRKIVSLFINKHNSDENAFYADLLSHLLKDKLNNNRLVLNVAQRGSSTGALNLRVALGKAKLRALRSPKHSQKPMGVKVSFNVQPFDRDPILSLADYSLWSVQRVFERGELRFYEYLMSKISLVVDLYDYKDESKPQWYNYYTNDRNPLTKENKIKLSE